MKRLTKTYGDKTHGAENNLPCGENSYECKNMLLERLGKYEDTKLDPEEIEAIKNNGGWIPVSERLPDNHNNVLICSTDKRVNVGYYASVAWRDVNSYPYGHVTAWRPLPESYRPQ